MYALNKLEDAKCGAITKSVNDKVTQEVVDEFHPNHAKHLDKSTAQLDKEKERELRDRHIDRKTTLKWLKRMMERGLVKMKNDVYSLTQEGHDENIFGEYYGRLLYQELMEMPFKGTLGDKLEEYVKRVGIYVTYIFMRNSNRPGIKPWYSAARNDYDEWVNDSISPVLLLEWFNNVFYSKSGSNNYEKLAKLLNTRFTKYIKNLETSEKKYYEKVFPFLHQHSTTMLKMREQSRLDYS